MSARVEAGIDAEWLDRLFSRDPAAHALALWDRLAWPAVIEFRTLFEDGQPTAYLLFWKGLEGTPVIHWGGEAEDAGPLLEQLPGRPFLAVVPPEVVPGLLRARGPATVYPLRLRRRWSTPPVPEARHPTRRLGPGDLPPLRALAEKDGSSVTDTYLSIDLERDWVVGGFAGGRLVAAARAEVRLPRVWYVSGVYTDPGSRGAGWGRAVVGHLLRDAHAQGAGAALFVREDNLAARSLYDRLGFDRGETRAWVDVGASRAP